MMKKNIYTNRISIIALREETMNDASGKYEFSVARIDGAGEKRNSNVCRLKIFLGPFSVRQRFRS